MDTMAGTVDARGAVVNTLEDRTVRVICALQIDKVFITRSHGWQNDGDPEGHQHHQNCAL